MRLQISLFFRNKQENQEKGDREKEGKKDKREPVLRACRRGA
jgi:hypothetical protein